MNLVSDILTSNYQKPKQPNFKQVKFNSFFGFECLGVKIGVKSNEANILELYKDQLPELFPIGFKEISYKECEFIFSIYKPRKNSNKNIWINFQDDSFNLSYPEGRFDLLNSKIRLTVAEFCEHLVFLHAGVVSYKGKAIVIPARSFSGKTTLVAEFSKSGLEYYSDEYAVIDRNGYVIPFTKKLSMRGIINSHQQVDISVEEMGGKKGVKPIRVGWILISKYQKGSKFLPKIVSSGMGVIECISNSVSIRQNPQLVLKVLGIITNEAKIIKTNRGEAPIFSKKLLSFIDKIEG